MPKVDPPQNPTTRKENPWLVCWLCAGLAAAVFLVFGQTLRNGFINLDDDLYVYANPHVANGFTAGGIVWAFTSCRPTGNWHPLTWLSHMLDCQIYGLNPAGHHLTNVLLHAATAIFLLLALRRMTGALWPSALVAALFAVHPLRVESVAWVSERKDVLSGLCFMLTLLMYARYVQKKSATAPQSWLPDYGWMLLFFTLGLLAKSMLVTLPFVLLLLDVWPLQRCRTLQWRSVIRQMLLEKLPLFLLTALAGAVTFLTQKSAGALAATPPLLQLENALVSYVSYILKMFWPENLALLYPYPASVPLWQWAGAGAVLLAITALAIMQVRRRPYLLVGWLWYLGMLVPVIGLVQVGGQSMADRYSYLPQIGLYLALVWGVKDFTAHRQLRSPVLGIAVAGVIVILMGCSLNQISYWRNSESLWTHTIACTPGNPVAQIDLGLALEAEGQLDEAIKHYQKAVEIRPDHPYAYIKLGMALVRGNRLDEAIEDYAEAVHIDPDDAEVHNNLANLLANRGRFVEAAEHYQEAIRINPDYAVAHRGLANLLVKQGRLDEAIGYYQKAVQINPDDVEAHYNLGVLLAARARLDEAAEHFRKVIELKPDYADAHGNLANVLVGQGQLGEAVEQYRKTIELSPNSAQAHYKLGLALEKQKQFAAAVTEYQKTLDLDPRHLPVHVNLAWLLATCPDASLRDGRQAIKLAQQARQIAGVDEPQLLDTLAAAYAESGRFNEAVETARLALNLPAVRNNKPLADAIQTRLKLYEAGSPFRDMSQTNAAQ